MYIFGSAVEFAAWGPCGALTQKTSTFQAVPWIRSCTLPCAFREHFHERGHGSNYTLRSLELLPIVGCCERVLHFMGCEVKGSQKCRTQAVESAIAKLQGEKSAHPHFPRFCRPHFQIFLVFRVSDFPQAPILRVGRKKSRIFCDFAWRGPNCKTRNILPTRLISGAMFGHFLRGRSLKGRCNICVSVPVCVPVCVSLVCPP